MQSTRDLFQIQRHTGAENEKQKKRFHVHSNQKRAGVSILILNEIDVKF